MKTMKCKLPARYLLAFFEFELHELPLVEVSRRDDVPLVIVDSVELDLPANR